jgi:hypothetical protein
VVDVQADLRLVWLQIRNLSFDAIFTDLPLEEHGFILSDTVVFLPKTPSMNSFLFYISEKLSCAPVLMVKTTDMRNCHDLSLFWRFN